MRAAPLILFAQALVSACSPSILVESRESHQSVLAAQALDYRSRWTESSLTAYHKSNTNLRLKVFALETIPLALDKAAGSAKSCLKLDLRTIEELPKTPVKYFAEGKEKESPPWSARDRWEIDACGLMVQFDVFDTRDGFHIHQVRTQ